MLYLLLGLAALVALVNAYRVASFNSGPQTAAVANNSNLQIDEYESGENTLSGTERSGPKASGPKDAAYRYVVQKPVVVRWAKQKDDRSTPDDNEGWEGAFHVVKEGDTFYGFMMEPGGEQGLRVFEGSSIANLTLTERQVTESPRKVSHCPPNFEPKEDWYTHYYDDAAWVRYIEKIGNTYYAFVHGEGHDCNQTRQSFAAGGLFKAGAGQTFAGTIMFRDAIGEPYLPLRGWAMPRIDQDGGHEQFSALRIGEYMYYYFGADGLYASPPGTNTYYSFFTSAARVPIASIEDVSSMEKYCASGGWREATELCPSGRPYDPIAYTGPYGPGRAPGYSELERKVYLVRQRGLSNAHLTLSKGTPEQGFHDIDVPIVPTLPMGNFLEEFGNPSIVSPEGGNHFSNSFYLFQRYVRPDTFTDKGTTPQRTLLGRPVDVVRRTTDDNYPTAIIAAVDWRDTAGKHWLTINTPAHDPSHEPPLTYGTSATVKGYLLTAPDTRNNVPTVQLLDCKRSNGNHAVYTLAEVNADTTLCPSESNPERRIDSANIRAYSTLGFIYTRAPGKGIASAPFFRCFDTAKQSFAYGSDADCASLSGKRLLGHIITDPSGAPAYQTGDRVKTSVSASVRETPGGTQLSPMQGAGNVGIVLEGPQKVGNYTWWRINWDALPDGWTAQDSLSKAAPSDGNCNLGGVRLKSTESATFYSRESVAAPGRCDAYDLVRRCVNGVLSGSSTYRFASCEDSANSDTTAPTVRITSPAANTPLSGIVTLSASSSDGTSVRSVLFRVDGTAVERDKEAPFTFAWDSRSIPDGVYRLIASARDPAGNRATTTRRIVVRNNPDEPLVPLIRYRNASDHMAITRPLSAEEIAAGYVHSVQHGYVSPVAATGFAPLYLCASQPPSKDRFVSLSSGCEGATQLELIGYVWTTAGNGRHGIYQCGRVATQGFNRFTSGTATCADIPGATAENNGNPIFYVSDKMTLVALGPDASTAASLTGFGDFMQILRSFFFSPFGL